MRVQVRVQPGARRARVGGRRGDALVVAVTARPVDGAATDAVLTAVVDAFAVKRRHVRLITGATSRDKVLEIDTGDDGAASTRLAELMEAP